MQNAGFSWYLSLVLRKPVFGISDQVRHKPGCTATEMAWGLKFRIQEVEEFYYPYSENKGADQLRGYREADMRLLFSHMQKAGFLTTRLILFLWSIYLLIYE